MDRQMTEKLQPRLAHLYTRELIENPGPRLATLTDSEFLQRMHDESFTVDFDASGWIDIVDYPHTPIGEALFADFYLRWPELNAMVNQRFNDYEEEHP